MKEVLESPIDHTHPTLPAMPIPRSRFPDYYSDLRIAPDASQDEVRSAWRQAAKRWHPDTNGSADAPAMMRRLNEAWDVLGDPNNRREYDDMYYVWRSSSEQLAVGLRERLNETRQRTRDEAAAWSRWADQDRTTWQREPKQEPRTSATGPSDEGSAANPAGTNDESVGQESGEGTRSDDWLLGVALAIAGGVVLMIAIFALAYND